ncbi:MAG: transcriptional repressor LexA [Clostridia bacterium]|nr:transcriptional repressor LexA [Clostridia bacterium]
MMELVKKEKEVYEFIKKQIGLEGYPPSVREICAAVGLSSPSTIQRYINSLEEKGFIVKGGSKKRAITLPKQENEVEVMSVPVVGTVAAGQPILAEENIAEYFPLPMNYAGKKDMFMLKVRGESMINAGILDGDFVIVESADTARNGEIVVALLEDSATVKTYYREKEYIRLQPENDALEPIISKDVKILGKVSGVFRKY